jgi:aminoglycoside phosphotransferase (APT) family kinase protein
MSGAAGTTDPRGPVDADGTDAAVDRDALARFLAVELPAFSGPFELERLGDGQSCLTFLVGGDGWEVVLRRPPRGELPPTAFDVTREYRVMRALGSGDAGVPVPRVLAL